MSIAVLFLGKSTSQKTSGPPRPRISADWTKRIAASAEDAEIHKLINAIDNNPDSWHGNRTPSVDALIDIGEPAIPCLLDFIEKENGISRIRGTTALHEITSRMYGLDPATRHFRGDGRSEWETLWNNARSLDSNNDSRRKKSVDVIRKWWDSRQQPDSDNSPEIVRLELIAALQNADRVTLKKLTTENGFRELTTDNNGQLSEIDLRRCGEDWSKLEMRLQRMNEQQRVYYMGEYRHSAVIFERIDNRWLLAGWRGAE